MGAPITRVRARRRLARSGGTKILCMLPAAEAVYPLEAEERRMNLMRSYEKPGTQIDVDYMPEPSGFIPWGRQSEPGSRPREAVSRAHELAAMRALRAEDEGYDAFCPFGVLDIGVVEARNRGLKIPAVGQAEA